MPFKDLKIIIIICSKQISSLDEDGTKMKS
jgi:hypothetical protein